MKKAFLALYEKLAILKLFLADYRHVVKYARNCGPETRDKQLATIMLLMHALEKGMSFRVKKQNWGADKANSLATRIESYLSCFGMEETIETAIHILKAYSEDPFGCKKPQLTERIAAVVSMNSSEFIPFRGGALANSLPCFDVSYEQLLSVCQSRRSIRYFSPEPLTEPEIEKAKAIARSTPSACNRQSCRLYCVNNPEIIGQLLAVQQGGQGWCENAPDLFVVTSNISYFGAINERMEPYIDGGMFAMNFVLGLHIQQIASCFKMYVRNPEADKVFRNLLGIPPQETPIVLIFAGHPDKAVHYSPVSYRNKSCNS